ncbi:hypothetical protein D3C79_843900 [compost metagenome]
MRIGLPASLELALLSMLNKMTSALLVTALSMSARIVASRSLLASKKETALRALPWSSRASMLASRYDKVLRKCDLPEPKKPLIHTPTRLAMEGSLKSVL